MITRIEATRYRCLERIAVDLPSYGILVGANGSGKTTFLDIPRLLGDCFEQRDVTQAFTHRQDRHPPRCSNLKELIFGGHGNDFVLAIEAALPEMVVMALLSAQSPQVQSKKERWPRFVRYEVRFEIFNDRQLQIKNEYLFLFSESTRPERDGSPSQGETNPHRDWRFVIKREYGGEAEFRIETQRSAKSRPVKLESSMPALPRVQFESREDFPAASWLHELLVRDYLFYEPKLSLLQVASPPGLPETLTANASNLPWLALALQKDDTLRFNLWQDHVRTALPQIEKIEVREREDDHHAYFAVYYQGGYMVTSSGLSEGTLRILALTILPYVSTLPAIVFLEEPENGIHPRAIEAVLQSLSSAYGSQVLISSHSPVVLANSKLDQILCARLERNGAASIVPGREHPQLLEWKGRIDLGALFAAGVLG